MRTAVAILLAAAAAIAQSAEEPGSGGATEPSVEELAKRNAELLDRVRKLEGAALEEDVRNYLEVTETAQGADGILPGGRALRVSGEVRIRWELQDHLYSPTDPDGENSFNFAHMRTRLRFDLDVVENVAAVVEFQDIRTLGEEGSTTADTQGVDIKRAEMIFREILGQPLMVEAGRFVMAYGDHRLIGDLEWFDQGRTYDGIRSRYERGDFWIDGFWVVVRQTIPADDSQDFGGLYSHWKWLEGYALLLMDHSALAGETGTGHTDLVTLGLRAARETDRWKYSAEAAFQTGDVRGDGITAFAMALWIRYTLADTDWKPQLILEVDYASGDDDPTDGDNGQMQTLFPTNHQWYGYADLVGWSNIIDVRLALSATPLETITITVEYHHFRRPEDQGAWINAGGAVVRPGAIGVSNHLGDEIDLTFTWKPVKQVSFLLGWSIFFPGGFVEDTGDSPVTNFAYVQGRVTF
jgi:Alginate export